MLNGRRRLFPDGERWPRPPISRETQAGHTEQHHCPGRRLGHDDRAEIECVDGDLQREVVFIRSAANFDIVAGARIDKAGGLRIVIVPIWYKGMNFKAERHSRRVV
jgi:hypothetical protein